MTPKEYLSQALLLDRRIDAQRDQIARLRALLNGGCAKYSDMPRGGKQSDWTDTDLRLVDAEFRCQSMIDKMLMLRQDIENAIAAVPVSEYRDLLTYRYLNGMSLARIAYVMHYSYDHVRHMHGWALQQVIIPDDTQ